MRLVDVLVRQRGPLSDAQVAAAYELAEKLKVGICLQGASTPRDAVLVWNTSGGITRILRFSRALRKAGRP